MRRHLSQLEIPDLPIKEGVEFRHCPGWLGYAIGSDGTIVCCWRRRNRWGIWTFGQWKPVAVHIEAFGYSQVSLSTQPKKWKSVRLHVLVLEAFVGPRPSGYECRHLDGNPQNNTVENLRWGTVSENRQDSILHGTFVGLKHGERHGGSVLSDLQIADIRRRFRSGLRKSLAMEFGVSPGHIYRIAHGYRANEPSTV